MKKLFKKYNTWVYTGVLSIWAIYVLFELSRSALSQTEIFFMSFVVVAFCIMMIFDFLYKKSFIYETKTLELLKQINTIIKDFDQTVELHNAFVLGYNELDDSTGKYSEDNVYTKIQKPLNDPEFLSYMQSVYQTIHKFENEFHELWIKIRPNSTWKNFLYDIFYGSKKRYEFVKNQKDILETSLSVEFKKYIHFK